MKLIAAAAILEKGLADPNKKFDCHGHTSIQNDVFNCQFAHGHVDLTMAIALSCNAYFIDASKHIPTAVFLEFAKILGLDAPVANRPSGKFPATPDAASYTYVLGVNNDLQPSALQLLRLSALIACEGNIPDLRSAQDMEPGNPFHATLAESTWRRLQQGMQLSVKKGTSKNLDPENKMHIAAKTGTTPHGKKFQSCITGYFPYDKPRHAFCVWAPSGTSQESAVPEAHKFLFSTEWP